MNYQTLIFVLSISGTIIIILLSIIGFFTKKLIETVDSLKAVISKLELIIGVHESEYKNLSVNCVNTHNVVNKRLDEHAHRITESEKEIIEIKARAK